MSNIKSENSSGGKKESSIKHIIHLKPSNSNNTHNEVLSTSHNINTDDIIPSLNTDIELDEYTSKDIAISPRITNFSTQMSFQE